MNKAVQSFQRLVPLAVVALIASCGGGGGDAGDSTEFTVVPAKVSFKAAKGDTTCLYTAGTKLTFSIVGGQPPYRIVNSVPQYLDLDRTEATGKDPQFKVTTRTGCGDPLTLLILDFHSQSASVEITIEKGEEAS